jgi:hypothetical protein
MNDYYQFGYDKVWQQYSSGDFSYYACMGPEKYAEKYGKPALNEAWERANYHAYEEGMKQAHKDWIASKTDDLWKRFDADFADLMSKYPEIRLVGSEQDNSVWAWVTVKDCPMVDKYLCP